MILNLTEAETVALWHVISMASHEIGSGDYEVPAPVLEVFDVLREKSRKAFLRVELKRRTTQKGGAA